VGSAVTGLSEGAGVIGAQVDGGGGGAPGVTGEFVVGGVTG